MRLLAIATVVTGLLAASSHGTINIKLTADDTVLDNDQSTTVRLWAQGTQAGIFSLAGDIVASGDCVLTASPGSAGWQPVFSPNFGLFPIIGGPGPCGGWQGIGSQQTDYLTPDLTLGKNDYVELFHYTVTANPAPAAGTTTLSFTGKSVGGYKPAECDKGTVIGTITPLQIQVTPEPATLALVALGGLLAFRRRFA